MKTRCMILFTCLATILWAQIGIAAEIEDSFDSFSCTGSVWSCLSGNNSANAGILRSTIVGTEDPFAGIMTNETAIPSKNLQIITRIRMPEAVSRMTPEDEGLDISVNFDFNAENSTGYYAALEYHPATFQGQPYTGFVLYAGESDDEGESLAWTLDVSASFDTFYDFVIVVGLDTYDVFLNDLNGDTIASIRNVVMPQDHPISEERVAIGTNCIADVDSITIKNIQTTGIVPMNSLLLLN